jgi:hypothetical protein
MIAEDAIWNGQFDLMTPLGGVNQERKLPNAYTAVYRLDFEEQEPNTMRMGIIGIHLA